jgi:uncharacterized membrane protein YphA (DoxX/SURF4 family)
MTSLFVLGRIIFGAYFLYAGINHFQHEKNLTGYAKMKGVPSPKLAVLVSGIMLIVGGAGILLHMYVSQSALLLIIFMIPTTFMMHNFWKGGDAMQKMNDQVAFLKNVALIASLLMMFAM